MVYAGTFSYNTSTKEGLTEKIPVSGDINVEFEQGTTEADDPPQPSTKSSISVSQTIDLQFTPLPDVSVSIDANSVVPANCADLHLNQLFGTESIEAAVTVDAEDVVADQDVTVGLYLSPTPTLAATSDELDSRGMTLSLGSSSTTLKFSTVIPADDGLATGSSYYLVAKVSLSTQAPNLINSAGESNIAATGKSFEYLGSPKFNQAVFQDGTYYSFVRNLLNGNLAVRRPPYGSSAVDAGNAQQFIAVWEGDVLHPYKDSKGIPTIGVGVNLKTVSGTTRHDLAKAVRAYYKSHYSTPKVAAYTDGQVIAMLRSQAGPHARQASSASNDKVVFKDAYNEHLKIAQSVVGTALNSFAQVAIVDLVYNVGSVFSNVAAALNHGDFVLAGFALVDATRTTQGGNLNAHSEADYQDLLMLNRAELGTL